ncbi:hypothetical protein HK096_003708 [Nowakowskiella sp. JEL0078]|nr:hypothetical protein HK096_003708 [Nowakowskiella sp. JEL0078]
MNVTDQTQSNPPISITLSLNITNGQIALNDLLSFLQSISQGNIGELHPNFQGQPPASEKAIKSQLVPVIIDSTSKICPICCDNFPVSDTNISLSAVVLPCGHPHHRVCLESWLHTSNTCPVCRFEIETDNPEYNRGVRERMEARAQLHVNNQVGDCFNKSIGLCFLENKDHPWFQFECKHVYCESCFKTDIAERFDSVNSILGETLKCPGCRKESRVKILLENCPVKGFESIAKSA